MSGSKKIQNGLTGVLFLAPVAIPFIFTVLIPFFVGIFYSMTDWNGIKYTNFVGFANYSTIFSQNSDYVYSLLITAAFTVVSILVVNLLAFAQALLCTANIRFTNFCRSAFFIPNLIGGIVLGYVWQFIFNRVFVEVFAASMLAEPTSAFFAIVIVYTWQYAGYIMMIYVTGLQTIPQNMLEASGIDGAGAFRTMVKIKIPMIMNTFTICLFLTLVNSFRQFDLNFAITGGGPARLIGERAVQSTEFLALNIYNTAFGRNDFSMGQAKSVVFFLMLAVVSLTQVWISKKREVEM